MGILMRLQIILLICLFVSTALAHAEEDESEIEPNWLEGEHEGYIERTDGTRLAAKYKVSYSDANVASLLVKDEDENTYKFGPVAIEKEMISFLWNARNDDSRCELLLTANNSFVGECIVFQGQTLEFTLPLAELHTKNEQ
jgi:hypothetical protein